MDPFTAMQFVVPDSVVVTGERTLRFKIDLRRYSHLRDKVLVQEVLNAYLNKYNKCESLLAEFDGDTLFIIAVGNYNDPRSN